MTLNVGAVGIRSDSKFQAALSSAELFRQLLESAPDAIVGIGRDGRIAFVNAQTEKLFGYAREELIGVPVEKLGPDRHHGAHSGHRSAYFTDPRTRPMGAGLDLYGLDHDPLPTISADADRIFVLFQRLPSQDSYAGARIGLALCKKIVDAHHGRIWVTSEPGAGSTFHCGLPAARPESF